MQNYLYPDLTNLIREYVSGCPRKNFNEVMKELEYSVWKGRRRDYERVFFSIAIDRCLGGYGYSKSYKEKRWIFEKKCYINKSGDNLAPVQSTINMIKKYRLFHTGKWKHDY